ncbi:hypothetical protein C9374_003351 [Naegleria lovaniensis]|uniref:acyl-CoA oxidase n=1 Tax=Naegleria lovaniensis TaxID=51637 RepID=A0AA88GTJ1_NAELO|nr:uncharacterized protein C9374_003351 [Naegleria lovaniensis]KAG2385536.1 hypothetical protein C9374_003351 [Naegleria lovaniensis]
MPKDQDLPSDKSPTTSNLQRSSRIQKALQEASDQGKIKIEDKNGQRRMDMLRSHLNPDTQKQEKSSHVTTSEKGVKSSTKSSSPEPQKQQNVFPTDELTAYLSPFSPKENKAREKVVQAMRDRPDLFHPYDIDLSRIEKLDLNYERMKYLVKEKKCFSVDTLEHEPATHFAAMSAVAYFDPALSVKTMLQFNFWAGTLLSLGTQRHRKYFDKIDSLELMGSYAITELAHGSNVRGIQTTATYCADSDTFEIHTPSREACKWWIGNSRHCHMCLVFAQLIVGKENHGVHCFVVPVRDSTSNEILPGVIIGDCTVKEGLDNLDNGFLLFNNVHIPRENLLNKHGDVTEAGKYQSPYKNASQRFGAMLSTLTMGRYSICGSSTVSLAKTLATTIGFSFERRQFGISNKPENPVINFQAQKHTIYPMLAEYFAFRFASNHLHHLYVNRTPETSQTLHVLSAGFKAYLTDRNQSSILKLREKCGGLGYSQLNRIGLTIANHDIFKTFEGDNTVLFQEVSKYLLANFKNIMSQKYSNVFSSVGYYVLDSLNSNVKGRHLRNATDLLDSNFYLTLFETKLEKQVQSVATRFRDILNELQLSNKESIPKDERKEVNKFNAWNLVQTQLLETSIAYVENEILQIFHNKVKDCPHKQTKQILQKQLHLFVLGLIEKNSTYFLTHDLMSPKLVKQLVKEKARVISSMEDGEILGLTKTLVPDVVYAPICNYEGIMKGVVSTDPSPMYDGMLIQALNNRQLFGNATFETIGLQNIKQ